MNLLSNALKFTKAGSVGIMVRCDEHLQGRQTIVIDVVDSGMGISPEHQEQIFNPLFRVDSSMTRHQQGTGLGLAICQRLIGQMQGTIGVQSVLGKGATFTVKIPLKAELCKTSRPSGQTAQTPVFHGKVIVAEDSEPNMVYMRHALARYGIDIVEAVNGHEVIRHVDSDPQAPKLILMDLQMPICDGFAATKLLRERQDAGSQIPIVAVTANADAETRMQCTQAGMDGFLAKPLSITILGDLLSQFLEASHPETHNAQR